MPRACTLDGLAVEGGGGGGGKSGSNAAAASSPPLPLTDAALRTQVRPFATHVEYDRLWYSDGRWYALVDDGADDAAAAAGATTTKPTPAAPAPAATTTLPPFRASRNVEVSALRVRSASDFARSVRWRAVTGDTLVLDYVYFVHPTAIGHWWEMMAPLYSLLRRFAERRAEVFAAVRAAKAPAAAAEIDARSRWRRPDQVVLLHLQRSHLMEWVRSVVAVALTGGEDDGGFGGGGGGFGVGARQQQPQSRRLELPPILLQREDVWDGDQSNSSSTNNSSSSSSGGDALVASGGGGGARQIQQPLLGARPGEWLLFERALIVRDASVGAGRSFQKQSDARAFRAEVYRAHGVEDEDEGNQEGGGFGGLGGGSGNGGSSSGNKSAWAQGPAPRPWTNAEACARGGRLVLFQRKTANRRVHNERALLEEVWRAAAEASASLAGASPSSAPGGSGEASSAKTNTSSPAPIPCPPPRVRAVEFTSATPFATQLREVSKASFFLAAHTSNLANAAFLRPGSVVLELLQRHWGGWGTMDRAFFDHSKALGDVHHWAWRARGANETVYRSRPRDEQRFAHWRSKECVSEACVEAHTEVDLVADVGAVGRLLRDNLPRAWRDGARPADVGVAWPEA
jgi:protein O-GlcNAc transferase